MFLPLRIYPYILMTLYVYYKFFNVHDDDSINDNINNNNNFAIIMIEKTIVHYHFHQYECNN
jgi:hypothetical protein